MKLGFKLLLVAIIAVVVFPGVRFFQKIKYQDAQINGAVLVDSLYARCPETVSADVWEEALDMTKTAYGNVCFSEEHVSLVELKALIADTEAKLSGPVDLATLDWFWGRLAQTGSHGEAYINGYEPTYRMMIFGE